jgi:hypothetical protein
MARRLRGGPGADWLLIVGRRDLRLRVLDECRVRHAHLERRRNWCLPVPQVPRVPSCLSVLLWLGRCERAAALLIASARAD